MRKLVRCVLTLIYSIYLKNNNIYIKSSVVLNRKTRFEGSNVIGSNCFIINSSLGFGSYIGQNSFIPNANIGKFCSIASGVKILPFTHPSHVFVSTHPAFFSLEKQAGFTYVKKQVFEERIYLDKSNNIFVEIGNDVWIGEDVKIMGGIRIGHGAIIATGAVVTKDVEAYSIIGGIPAKHIKYRFSKDEISFLLNFKWWDKNLRWIENNSKKFKDINILKKEIK